VNEKKKETKGKFDIHGYARKTEKREKKKKKAFNFSPLNFSKCRDESGNTGKLASRLKRLIKPITTKCGALGKISFFT
jgi:hypothetical protein